MSYSYIFKLNRLSISGMTCKLKQNSFWFRNVVLTVTKASSLSKSFEIWSQPSQIIKNNVFLSIFFKINLNRPFSAHGFEIGLFSKKVRNRPHLATLGSRSPLILGPKARVRIKFLDQDQEEILGSNWFLS